LGPVLQHETGDTSEVADVARDQDSLVLEHDCSNPEIHPADVQLQPAQVLKAGDRRESEGKDRKTGKKKKVVDQALVSRYQLIRLLRLAEQVVPTGELLLQTDDRDRQFFRPSCRTPTDGPRTATLEERHDVRIQHEQAHDASAS